MGPTLRRAWKWPVLAALAVAGVLAATAATSSSATTAATTTTTTASTTTAPTTTTTTTTTTAGTKPASTSAPTISGSASDGSAFTAATGTWTGTQPIAYVYQWQRCSSSGSSCSSISDATKQTYTLTSADVGNTVRAEVTASNTAGSSTAASATSSVVAAKAPTTTKSTTTTPASPGAGCPAGKAGSVVQVAQVTAPARLQTSSFQSVPGRLTGSTQSFRLRIVVTDTCNQRVQGALVYATAVPFEQFNVPAQAATGADGSATLTFTRESGYPASRRQELLAMFLRASKPGDPVLSGISSRRLIALPVSLKG